MKAYKGFNKDMTCRGFQFEEGKTYEEPTADLCNRGFHACEAPLDVFRYYPPASSVYHEVELDGVSDQRENNDSKVCGKVIKIGARLDIAGLAKAQFEYVKAHCTNENSGGYGSVVSGGDRSAVSGGDRSAVSGGYGSAVSGGNESAVSGGYGSAVTSRGSSSVGENGAALARGNNVKVRGGLGAILVAAEENNDDFNIKSWCASVVDGATLKPDVWYRCVDGKFVEVE